MSKLLLLGLLAAPLAAQISLATLSGTIKDSTGSVIPNAIVETRNLSTNQARTVKSGATGEYVLTDLAAEHYQLKVTFAGIQILCGPDLELQVGQHATLDATLQAGPRNNNSLSRPPRRC